MSDVEAEADGLARLEAALDRIARHAHPASSAGASAPAGTPEMSELAARLEMLANRVRDVLEA